MNTQNTDLTHFTFASRVFSVAGARFAMHATTREARLYVHLGGMDVSMSLPAVKNEFNILPDSHDAKLIGLVADALKYVPDIRPGDTIPTEIINGKASWSVLPKHQAIANQRLHVQLLSWVSGKEIVITDANELGSFIGQIENKARLRAAFEAAATALGRPASDYEGVLSELDLIARELSYIEALRDRLAVIMAISRRLESLQISYGSEGRAGGELRQVNLLMKRAVDSYAARFGEIDAQTSEIIAALKSIDRQIDFIRKTRNTLYFTFRDWEPLAARWAEAAPKRSRVVDLLISDTYRLLASRFSTGRSMLKAA